MNLKTVTICLVCLIPLVIVFCLYIDHTIKSDTSHLDQCINETCVRLCCKLTPCDDEIHSKINDLSIIQDFNKSYRILRGNPCPTDQYKGYYSNLSFIKNGHVEEIYDLDSSLIHDWHSYCLDIDGDEPVVHICFELNLTESIQALYPYFMIASIPFLIITLFVYGCVKELRSLHGKNLMSYVFSLALMYTTLSITNLWDHEKFITYNNACKTFGYLSLISIFCCFFWTNVMCVDIYMRFRIGMRSESNKRFLMYCAYAFGTPILIVMIMFVVNEFDLIPDRFKNNIGTYSCIVSEHEQHDNRYEIHFIYIYGPIILFLIVNITLYTITATKIYQVQKQSQKSFRKGTESRKHSKYEDDRMRFFLYMRLSIGMGVPWIIEVLSWLVGNSVILFLASFVNCLQGFVIFATFVWKSNVKKLVARKYSTIKMSYRKSQRSLKSDSSVTEATKMNNTQSLSCNNKS